MKSSDEHDRLAAVTRRTAVAASLWQARTDVDVQSPQPQLRATLVDDVCRLAWRLDELGISEVTLARVALEGDEAASRLARVIYGARLLERGAQGQGSQPQAGRPQSAPTAAQEPAGVSAPDLPNAFVALREAGKAQAYAPRRLLDGLCGLGSGKGATARLLAAAQSEDVRALVPPLSSAPYCIDPGFLSLALSRVEHEDGRKALAAAVAQLRGGEAKEAALAATVALDAARLGPGCGTLAVAVVALADAMRSFAAGTGTQFEDSDLPVLLQAAACADAVWAQLDIVPPAAARVAHLCEALTSVQLPDDLEFFPDDGASGRSARLEFTDRTSSPIAWSSLAAALDAEGADERPSTTLLVTVETPLTRALTAYLEQRRSLERSGDAANGGRIWPATQAPLTFTAPPMTFSASRLNAYVKCPRRWFYEYLCQALEDPPSPHAAYGRAVHDALEALHQRIRVPSRSDPKVMLDQLLRDLDVAFGRCRDDFGSQLEYEVSRMRARRMADQYVRWLAAESARAPMEIVHVELLQRQRFGGHDFVGYLDRIDRPLGGGAVTIFDYKTGRIESDARAYLEKVKSGEEAQLALYYAMRDASGDDVARIALVSVRDPRDDVWILALDIIADGGTTVTPGLAQDGVLRVTCSREDLKGSLAALVARCDMLTSQGQDHFRAGDDPPCGFCAYAGACRERPDDGERIFAR